MSNNQNILTPFLWRHITDVEEAKEMTGGREKMKYVEDNIDLVLFIEA